MISDSKLAQRINYIPGAFRNPEDPQRLIGFRGLGFIGFRVQGLGFRGLGV